MKKILFNSWLLGALFLLTFSGCEEEEEEMVRTSIEPVVYIGPAANTFIELDPEVNAVVDFEWEHAKTGNGTLSFYEVLFDKESGDFTNPVLVAVPEKGGTSNLLKLTHRQLNALASKVGIGELQRGRIKWKVTATNGIDKAPEAPASIIEVLRPEGFAENPVNLYLLGSATEAKDNVPDALQFKKISDGIFEIYTSLEAGAFTFIDKTIGTPVTYRLDNSKLKFAEGSSSVSPATSKKVYRINLNFNDATGTITEIESIGLWVSASNRVTQELTYQADGIWKATDIPIVWATVAWGKDERYKFRTAEKDANGNVTYKFLGSSNKDNAKPTTTTPASYFQLNPVDASQWDFTYKFEKEGPKNDIILRLQPSAYTHQIIVKQ